MRHPRMMLREVVELEQMSEPDERGTYLILALAADESALAIPINVN